MKVIRYGLACKVTADQEIPLAVFGKDRGPAFHPAQLFEQQGRDPHLDEGQGEKKHEEDETGCGLKSLLHKHQKRLALVL